MTSEKIRKGSSLIRQFVALSFVEFKALRYDCHKGKQVCLEEIYVVVMFLPSYELVIWKSVIFHLSSFAVPKQNQV